MSECEASELESALCDIHTTCAKNFSLTVYVLYIQYASTFPNWITGECRLRQLTKHKQKGDTNNNYKNGKPLEWGKTWPTVL